MLALKITDIRDFTNKLFIGEVFDKFCLSEASITTFNTFTIDGRLQRDFFDTDSLNKLTEHGRTHSLWKEIRPFCWSVIRGKRTPLSFKIVLHLSRNGIEAAMRNTDLGISSEQIDGFYLNLQFKNNALLCTTGTSLKHINKLTIGRLVFQRISRYLIQKTFISFPADIDQCSDIVFYIRRSRFIFCCQTWINIFCDMHRFILMPHGNLYSFCYKEIPLIF